LWLTTLFNPANEGGRPIITAKNSPYRDEYDRWSSAETIKLYFRQLRMIGSPIQLVGTNVKVNAPRLLQD